jgi:hypothetical protein
MTYIKLPFRCLYNIALLLGLLTCHAAHGQAMSHPAPTPCDSARAFQVEWGFYEPLTDSLQRVLVAKTDSVIGVLPELAQLWKTELRARVLDTRIPRCATKDLSVLLLDQPKTIYAYILIYPYGFEIRRNSYLGHRPERLSSLRINWRKPLAAHRWWEEVIDPQTQTITKRTNFTDPPEIATISTEAGSITAIEVKRGDQLYGMQYSRANGQDRFQLVYPWTTEPRILNLADPQDALVWKKAGKEFFQIAFNVYFRLPAPLLEFGSPAEPSLIYNNPFVE